MNKLRKFLVIGVMALTVLATMGVTQVKASASAGDLIKMDGLSSVYYLGSDGKRYVFPNEATYMSWYSDFSGVVTITASELQSYPLGGNVTMRPGTKLVKITTDPSVYAVEPNGVLRKIQSEAQAAALYGSNWNKRVVDVADSFFTNYTIGSALANGSTPAGSLVKNANTASIYYYDGTNYRSIANESAFYANRFLFGNVLTISNTITAGGTAIANAEFVNVAQNGVTTGPIVTGSGLMVSLSSNTPVAASVPQTGARVPMAKVNLTAASDGAVTVNSITIKRIGLSSYGDIEKVWAEIEGDIIASKKTVNSNDEATLVFSPVLTINAGQTKTIDLIAELSADGGNIGLSIVSASAVSATAAAVTGSFPINGNIMSPTNYAVTDVNITSNISSAETVNIGDEAVELGNFKVEYAHSTTTRDIKLSSIMLKNVGAEDLVDVVSELYLENDGETVAEGVIDGKYVTFTFENGFSMLKSDGDQAFTIYGNIIGKELTTGSTVQLVFNKAEDLVAHEISNGFGVIVNTSAETVANLAINAGVVAVSTKSTNPDDDTVLANSNDEIALLANIRADQAINAEGLKVYVLENDAESFENVRVYVNNILVDSFDPADGTSTQDIDSSISLNAGDNEVKVTVDTTSDASSTATFKVKLDAADTGLVDGLLIDPEYSNGNTVAADDIDGSATGAVLTIAGATASAVRTDGYGDKTTVQGSAISLGKFTVKAFDDEVTITKIVVASTTDNDLPTSSIDDVKILVDGSQVGATKSFTSTGASFSPLTVKIAKNATRVIEVLASTDTAATGTLKVALSFTAKDSNGDAVTINPVSTVAFTVTDEGTLTIAKDGNSAASAILASKAGVEQAVASFKLTATDDSANVTSLTVTNASTTDVRIASLKLYNSKGVLLDEANPFSGTTEFTIDSNALVVAADASEVVTVKAVLNNITNDASSTDKLLQLKVTEVEFKASNGSKTVLADTDSPATIGTVTANAFYIRKTVPTIALMTLPNTALSNGKQVISKFTVTADSNADVKVSKLVVKIATTGSTTLASTTNAVKINGSSDDTTSTISGDYYIVDFGTSTPEIVSAGFSKTFEIIGDVTIEGSDRVSLSTTIEESAYGDALTNYFNWSDSASNTDASNVWFNSYRVKGLPSDTQTLSIN